MGWATCCPLLIEVGSNVSRTYGEQNGESRTYGDQNDFCTGNSRG
ncbi:hypothetical protein Goarm_019565 [Gossypium armourianum]|uniref:Uncharacterized protein n=1 Tax=Gossypium armourianum TaxID=34283 RepID=A0A7J9INN6_9ROSI|nr:hypothetical protein [Gossypium armourianum]